MHGRFSLMLSSWDKVFDDLDAIQIIIDRDEQYKDEQFNTFYESTNLSNNIHGGVAIL